MASGRMEFHADSIMQHANFSFVIPNDVEMAEVRNKKHYDRERKNLILRRQCPADGDTVQFEHLHADGRECFLS